MTDDAGRTGSARSSVRRASRKPGAVAISVWKWSRAVGWLLVLLTNVVLCANYDSVSAWCGRFELNVRPAVAGRVGGSSPVGVMIVWLDRME